MIRGGIRAAAQTWALATMIGGLSACGQQASTPSSSPASPPAASQAPAPAAQPQAAATGDRAEMLAHGKYLVETIAGCGNCHTPHLPDGTLDPSKQYAGAFVIKEPNFTAYARNITPDMETGIGSWSEDDIVKAVREAVRPDGRALGPPMSFVFYKNMADYDVRSIAAFLKTVPAVHNEVPPSQYDFPLMPNPPVGNIPRVPMDDPVKYGEYLAGPIGHCMDCHTTYVNGMIDMKQLGRGGNVYAMPFGYTWAAVSANITPDPDVGLGKWSDEEIKTAITTGVSRDGRKLLPFMPFSLYKNVKDSDLDAIIAYLRSIPALGPPAAPPKEQ